MRKVFFPFSIFSLFALTFQRFFFLHRWGINNYHRRHTTTTEWKIINVLVPTHPIKFLQKNKYRFLDTIFFFVSQKYRKVNPFQRMWIEFLANDLKNVKTPSLSFSSLCVCLFPHLSFDLNPSWIMIQKAWTKIDNKHLA